MVKIFLDGASIKDVPLYDVEGYTTNPSLIKAQGITNYMDFAKEFISVTNGLPVSFEVVTRDRIIPETKILSALGPNVYVKIPIDGYKNVEIIQELNRQGYKINATAVFTVSQVERLLNGISDTPMIISVFAGRIADTGIEPIEIMAESRILLDDKPNVELLWASTRENLNICEAEWYGCDIITVTPDILKKKHLFGKDLYEYSLETADQFYRDAESLIIE